MAPSFRQGIMEFRSGWHGQERDDLYPFRWMEAEARLKLGPEDLRGGRFLSLPVFSEFTDFRQVLKVSADGRDLADIALLRQWALYGIDLEADKRRARVRPADGIELRLTLNRILPPEHHPGDARDLGVRVGPLEFHDAAARHAILLSGLENARKLDAEFRRGATRVSAFPLNLGIDLYGKCSIHPACVYCPWDEMKGLEGRAAHEIVDEATLEGYGPFFRSARRLVNCSFGEPLLHPRIEQILELLGRQDKFAEISTNGQAFTPRVVRALAGKPVTLYVSLDAGTRETYARLRNDHWDRVVEGLRLLDRERKKAGGRPSLFMVFMPMRVNRGDLEPYFKLCRDIGAEALVLRPLLVLPNARPKVVRNGYVFDYAAEQLTPAELRRLLAEAAEHSKTYGVRVANQFDFGLTASGEGDS